MKGKVILGAALVAGAAYFALFGGEYSLLELQRLKSDLAEEQVRLEEARAEIVRLQARVDSLENDSATIERIARERYGLIRPGERLYRFVEDTARADTLP